MISESIKTHTNYYSLPLFGYRIDEIESNQSLAKFTRYYYDRVIIYGRNKVERMSSSLMVRNPRENLMEMYGDGFFERC
ncbi:MAG: hypothetical protein QME46_04715 [Thermoanaerobacteraceae bacterium]|nr:hypothetical protein [Thermoanaerobacteraceae bacterium]